MGVPLLSRRFQRAQPLQKVNHAVPSAGLIVVSAQALREGARRFDHALAIVEIGTSAILFAATARSMRAMRRPGDSRHYAHGIDGIDLCAAAILLAEAAERWHTKHHLARPTILTALVTLALGLSHGRIGDLHSRRRALKITSDGIRVGGRPFNAFTARWKDIAAISLTERFGEIRTGTGRVRLAPPPSP